MVKTSLIIIGVLILIITFGVLEIYLTQDAKNDIKIANSLCTAEVNVLGFNVPIGQKILGEEADCQNVHYMMLLINWGWIGYAFGALLFVLGIVLRSGKKAQHHEEPSKPQKHSSKHCGECGSKLEGHEKHCPECGKKI